MIERPPIKAWTHQRWVKWSLVWMAGMALAGITAIVFLAGNSLQAWDHAASAQAVAQALREQAGVDAQEVAPERVLPQLLAQAGQVRLALVLQSLLVVPACVGLWVLAAFVLVANLAPQNRWLAHALSLLPVAAGMMAWAENAMVGRAVRDYLTAVLADDTVRDILHAQTLKWGLVAATWACLCALHAALALGERQAAACRARDTVVLLCCLVAASFASQAFGLAWALGSSALAMVVLVGALWHRLNRVTL